MSTSQQWSMRLHDDFQPEFEALVPDVQDALLAAARAVEIAGPRTGRPHVDTLNGSKHKNMKELRFSAASGSQVWRAAFAFDPNQEGIILVAADKQGMNQKQFYKSLVNKADQRFDEHLETIRLKMSVTTVEYKAAKRARKP